MTDDVYEAVKRQGGLDEEKRNSPKWASRSMTWMVANLKPDYNIRSFCSTMRSRQLNPLRIRG